ncbi:hypothetical protein M7I_2864 [Glarea lozoyensis 74030]|uniref:Ig-like domain-containing protein n=1 Tax=Glarea lozoyensis (strain ATCC 74030 / MF5533) TaxID=1104152 RepID=H0EJY0_GLAL7|nr:hypothetical protein M7I_2864 [Glarea lozoyensis 74030]
MKLSTILALTGSLYSSFVYAGAFMDTEAAVCNVKNSTDGTLTPIAVSEVKAGMAIPSDTTGLSLRCSYGGSSVDEFENWFSSELATGSQAVERSALAEEKRAECTSGSAICGLSVTFMRSEKPNLGVLEWGKTVPRRFVVVCDFLRGKIEAYGLKIEFYGAIK